MEAPPFSVTAALGVVMETLSIKPDSPGLVPGPAQVVHETHVSAGPNQLPDPPTQEEFLCPAAGPVKTRMRIGTRAQPMVELLLRSIELTFIRDPLKWTRTDVRVGAWLDDRSPIWFLLCTALRSRRPLNSDEPQARERSHIPDGCRAKTRCFNDSAIIESNEEGFQESILRQSC
jgi:hypothetical protein